MWDDIFKGWDAVRWITQALWHSLMITKMATKWLTKVADRMWMYWRKGWFTSSSEGAWWYEISSCYDEKPCCENKESIYLLFHLIFSDHCWLGSWNQGKWNHSCRKTTIFPVPRNFFPLIPSWIFSQLSVQICLSVFSIEKGVWHIKCYILVLLLLVQFSPPVF